MNGTGAVPGEHTALDDLDERLLVLRAQDGDVEAFERLVEQHQGRLFRIAFLVLNDRLDAEDVVQESLVLAWSRLHLLGRPEAFRSWVSQICANRATDLARVQARRATAPTWSGELPSGSGTPADDGPGGVPVASGRPADPEREAVTGQQLRALGGVLATIPPDLRTCWVLREIDGMGYAQIAEVLGLTESTVRGRIARARALIIQRMQEWR